MKILIRIILRYLHIHRPTKQQWEIRGESYKDEKISDTYKKMYLDIAQRCLAEKPKLILEYGCGYGYLLKILSQVDVEDTIKKYCGIDFSSTQIANAKQYFPEGIFYCENLLNNFKLFDDEAFDVVVGVGVLMYIDKKNIDCVLSGLFRITKSKIFIVEYYYKYLSDVKKAAYDSPSNVDSRVVYDYDELLKNVGFKSVKVVHLDYFTNSDTSEMPHTLIMAAK